MSTTTNAAQDAALITHIASYEVGRRNLDAAYRILAPLLAAPPDARSDRLAAAVVLSSIVEAAAKKRDPDRAIQALEGARALTGDEGSAALWRAEGAVATARGDHEAAWSYAARAAGADPGSSQAWLSLGRAAEAAGRPTQAVEAYLRAASPDLTPTHGTMLAVAERTRTLAPADTATPATARVRIAVAGSSTLDYVASYLEVACRQAGLVPEFYLSPFDLYAQDILDPVSALYRFAPDIVILAVHGRAFFPDLYDAPPIADADGRRAAATAAVERMSGLLATLTSRTTALVLLHTFGVPQYSSLGALDLRDPFGQTAAFNAVNAALAERVRQDFPTVHLIDEDRVYGRVGKGAVTDPRLWYMARIGIGEGALGALTAAYMRLIKALKGRSRKCLVLDLDNTLWGGVVGEDGPTGIVLGREAPGNAYRAFQEAILQLSRRGVILAVNSKNNLADAMAVLDEHPDMILRKGDFAALRINWQDKATNLEEIAKELNIGVDSLVFMDDSPAECALVRARLPQVLTVQLPRDPALFRGVLLGLTDFDALSLTDEDRQRGKLYAQRRERQEWEARHETRGEGGSTGDGLGDFLADLGLVVEVTAADAFALPRIAQLIVKTNQFNLTTRRHNEGAVRRLAASDTHGVYGIHVRDRFGDHGLTGVAIVIKDAAPGIWEIDSLLLSCRVLGRGVETALLAVLAALARADGAHTLRGKFIPTPKNEPARDFYAHHGLRLVEEIDGAQTWELDLHPDIATIVPVPTWLTLVAPL